MFVLLGPFVMYYEYYTEYSPVATDYDFCRKYGIAELAVFGSVARGSARPDSDVDLLYVRVPGNDLGMSYFALQEDLEELFGRPVDLVPKDGLHRVIRDQVLADAQVLYAA